MLLEYILLYSLIVGMVVFCSTRKHLLLSLLSLEFVVLCVLYYVYVSDQLSSSQRKQAVIVSLIVTADVLA